MNNIPFLDLVTPHKEIEEELVAVFREALRTGRFIGGPNVEGFEKGGVRGIYSYRLTNSPFFFNDLSQASSILTILRPA